MLKIRMWAGATCLMLLLAAGALAQTADIPPMMQVGEAEVYALSDYRMLNQLSNFMSGKNLEIARQMLPSGTENGYINAYLVKINKQNILIDTGLGAERGGKLMLQLAELGLHSKDIDAVLFTHLHIDHVGGALAQSEPAFPQAVLWASQPEADYWGQDIKFPAAQQGSMPVAKQALQTKSIKYFKPGDEILPGISSMPAFGHTPGHSAFMITSGDARLLIWGDIMHVPSVQFANPDIGVDYDVDQKRAMQTRRQFLALVVEQDLMIAGMHLVFPGWGKVEKNRNDQDAEYIFLPFEQD